MNTFTRHNPARRLRSVALAALVLICQCGPAALRAAAQTSPLGFAAATTDAATGAAKNSFYLGETIAVVFTFTNQSGAALTMPAPEQLEISVKLSGTPNRSDRPVLYEGVRGGRSGSYVDPDGTVFFTQTPLAATTLAAGQKVTVRIDDLGAFFARRLEDGAYTLTAVYGGNQQAQATFSITIDEARSTPVLEQLAVSADESAKRWANAYLGLIRRPSVSGRVTAAGGQPLGGVSIGVTGSESSNIDTRADGRYDLTHLAAGGTYTLTPSLEGYTFDPARRTVSNLSGKTTGVDFVATRETEGTNVASEDTGGVATASSTLGEDYPVESVVNGSKSGIGWGLGSGGWSDGTPGAFPDWVEVNFGSAKSIDWINVYTLPDNFANPVEPTLGQTFTLHGITDFDVQYWNGSAWVTVPGGSVNGNTNVWRKFTFPTVTTSKIRVYVRGGKGGHSRITEIEAFHANVPPAVSFQGTYSGTPGAGFQFNYTASDPDGTIARYEWDFGDNTTATGPTQSHVYTQTGTYTVTLRVTDDGGETTTATTNVVVANPPKPPVSVAGGPYTGVTGQPVLFDGRASSDPDGTVTSYNWNFGDSTTATGPTPSHVYAQTGTFTVTLTVTDNSGMTASGTSTVSVGGQPPSVPAGLVATAASGTQVSLTWAASAQAHHYQIERSQSLNGVYTSLAGSPTTNSFADTGVVPGSVYFYRVKAVNATGNASSASNVDVAATFVFTDNPLVAGVTPIKALHVTELRQAVDALRASVGLQPATWTGTTLSGTAIRAAHLQELRSNLDQALNLIGVPLAFYTDTPLGVGVGVKRVHVEELRQRLK